ncbi:MAG: FAD binding domain-containing protein [Hyphomicrobiaceae bacterium]
MLFSDKYLMPTTLADALSVWRDVPENSRLIAGATDLLPWAREGRAGDVHVAELVDVSRVEELNGYSINGGRVRLGANVVYQDFLEDAALKAHLPCMPYCSIWFADDQIRRQATLAGNLINASPAADGTPPMAALNAEVEIARLAATGMSTRTVPLAEFISGPGKTTLQPGEIVTAVICDSCQGYGGAFEKVGQRRSLVISTVCAAALVKTSDDGKHFQDVRLALGGIGPVPVRLNDIEQKLIGEPITEQLIADVSTATDGLIKSRTRQVYRGEVVQGFIRRALTNATLECLKKSSMVDTKQQQVAHV